jgi:hypothetical protein
MTVLRWAVRAAAWVFWLPAILAELVRWGWLKCLVIFWRWRVARSRRRHWRMAVSSVDRPD